MNKWIRYQPNAALPEADLQLLCRGLLLARAGIDGLVLEKNADFLRDFCGDTIHPSNAAVALNLLAAPLREDRLTIGICTRFDSARQGRRR